jgi:hypothetical protein
MKVQSFFAIAAIKERQEKGDDPSWGNIVADMHNAYGLVMVPYSHKKVYDTWAAKKQ